MVPMYNNYDYRFRIFVYLLICNSKQELYIQL